MTINNKHLSPEEALYVMQALEARSRTYASTTYVGALCARLASEIAAELRTEHAEKNGKTAGVDSSKFKEY